MKVFVRKNINMFYFFFNVSENCVKDRLVVFFCFVRGYLNKVMNNKIDIFKYEYNIKNSEYLRNVNIMK